MNLPNIKVAVKLSNMHHLPTHRSNMYIVPVSSLIVHENLHMAVFNFIHDRTHCHNSRKLFMRIVSVTQKECCRNKLKIS